MTKETNSGWRRTRQHYVLVGLDKLNFGVPQEVISHISRQPEAPDRVAVRYVGKKNFHIARDNQAAVGAWDLTSVEIIIF
jgi:hypothetical protein